MRRNETLFDMADWLTDPPTGGPIQMWSVGVILSSIVTGYGVGCCILRRAITLNISQRGFRPLSQGFWLEIAGIHAVTFGLVVVSIGAFMHFQWFWGNHEKLAGYHEIGKYLSVLGLLIASVAHVYTMLVHT
ncbi:hypothetical protein FHS27_005115 [Rhodopirellula rubra]|uniref:Uncharacterized protein n=1 Tax=Aporhodopirellula rubra TaxID=980271 RepID=A0A7W5H8P2_9BACT|nr:hypothetical protein [Aporhodopirellula rubra]MBB3209275.1 hypothetical protein [Aporhodopirellula rubra]